MKDYTTMNPTFSDKIQVTETTDPAHADIINKAPIQNFQNTLYNRKLIEKLESNAGNAEAYNTETEYQKGNYCTYNNATYKCIQPTQGEWDSACWEKINLLKEISGLQNPEFDDSGDAEGAGITGFPAFLEKIKSKMNIFEFYRNFKAGMQFVLHTGQIVNNCASDATNLPLAAAQGKALWDRQTQLISDFSFSWQFTNKNAISIPQNDDMNAEKYRVPGVYLCESDANAATLSNCPTNGKSFTLFVYKPLAPYTHYVTQEFRTLYNDTYKRFWNFYDNAWKNELKYITPEDLNVVWQFTNKNAAYIPDNADMKSSTYLIPGVYRCDSDIRSRTLKNSPAPSAFTLFVYKSLANHAKYITQEFRTLHGNVYKRRWSGYDENIQNGTEWGPDTEMVLCPGLGNGKALVLSSGYGVYSQVGDKNNYTQLVLNNNYFAIEHFTNGKRDKSNVFWDGT